MKPGLYSGLTFEKYLEIPAINKSSLDDVRLSPKHYYARHLADNRPERKATRPMKLGTDIHTAILEPDRFKKDYVVIPEDAPAKPTKAMLEAKKPSDESLFKIAWWDAFNKENEGKTQITAEDLKICNDLKLQMQTNEAFKTLLSSGKAEITMVWEDQETGLLCKARIDWLADSGYLLDLKSVESAHPEDFGKKVYEYDWHVQAAFYLDGFKQLTGEDRLFVFGAIEKLPPNEVAAFFAKDEDLSRGRRYYRPLLQKIAESRARKKWDGYPTEIQPLKEPAWIKRQDADQTPETY